MRALLAIALTLCLAVLHAIPASAQNALIPPGAETLPENLRRLAATPLVLTPGSDRTACLGVQVDGDRYDQAEIKRCDTIWNQRVVLEPVDVSGDHLRMRFASLGCLYAGANPGLASIGICGDFRAEESWTVRGQQLVDYAGRCLEAGIYPYTKALRPMTAACNPAKPEQQWFVDSMRGAQDRLGSQGRAIWGMDSGRKDGLKREVVEQLRPRFTVRALTSAEKSEVRKLRDTWKRSPALPLLEMYGTKDYWSRRDKLAEVVIDWPVLKRLSDLAESGDKEAMHAVLEGMVVLRYGNAKGSYAAPGWRSDFPEQGNRELIDVVIPALSNIWAAHYWQRHGPDRLAALAGASCTKDCLGYSMRFVPVGKYANPWDWARMGKSDYDFKFEDFRFTPVTYSPEEAERKFIDTLTTLSYGEAPGADNSAFGAMYAQRTGRLALWDAVILSGNAERWGKASRPGQAMLKAILARRENAAWQAEFATFLAKPAPTPLELWGIQMKLVSRPDEDVMVFAQRYMLTDRDLLKRFCVGTRSAMPSCQKGLAWMAQVDAERAAASAKAQAETEARLAAEGAARERWEAEQARQYAAWLKTRKPSFWDQLAGLAAGFDAAMQAGSGNVTVREYDSAGNYLGSRQVNRGRALGSGATTGN